MIPELGYFCLIFVVGLSFVQVALSLWGEIRRKPAYLAFNPALSAAQLLAAVGSFAALAYAFWQDDFSVRYVANHSNSQLPDF